MEYVRVYATPLNISMPHPSTSLRYNPHHTVSTPYPSTSLRHIPQHLYATTLNISTPHPSTSLRHTPQHLYATPLNISTPHPSTSLRHTPQHLYATPLNMSMPHLSTSVRYTPQHLYATPNSTCFSTIEMLLHNVWSRNASPFLLNKCAVLWSQRLSDLRSKWNVFCYVLNNFGCPMKGKLLRSNSVLEDPSLCISTNSLLDGDISHSMMRLPARVADSTRYRVSILYQLVQHFQLNYSGEGYRVPFL